MKYIKCKHTFRTREELEKLHTKQLLDSRLFSYPSGCCDYGYCPYWPECKKEYDEHNKIVKEILATRPHIPNKKESKAIRKERINRGK